MKLIENRYQILSSDCDRYGFWKINRILVLMQELAGEHSERLGCGFLETLKKNAVWVVTRNEFAVDSYPAIGQVVVGKSFPGRARRGIYPRYYLIEDEQGQPLVRGSSFWVLADADTRQMVDIAEIHDAMPDTSEFPLPFHNPGAAEERKEGQQRSFSWRPVYTDIDRNGHVNNTRAADWALCFLSETADLQRHPVRSLLASYHRELLAGSQVEMKFTCRENLFSLRCDVEGDLALRMSGELFGDTVKPGVLPHSELDRQA